MASIFEEQHFLVRKWLLSMVEGEERLLPVSKMPYKNLKASCTQLHRIGRGKWSVSKKGLTEFTRVRRIS